MTIPPDLEAQILRYYHVEKWRVGTIARQLHVPARLDGLLCCADERLSDLSIPASHDRTLAPRPHAPQPAAPSNVDPNEDDRRPVPAIPTHPASVA